jgi:hypothetical protein
MTFGMQLIIPFYRRGNRVTAEKFIFWTIFVEMERGKMYNAVRQESCPDSTVIDRTVIVVVCSFFYAGVAQPVEQLICNQPVGGSNPFAS